MLRNSNSKHQKALPATGQSSVKLIEFFWIFKHKGDFLEFLPDNISLTDVQLHIKGFGAYKQLTHGITKAVAP